MKKISKIIICIAIVFLAICQINVRVYALSQMVKSQTNYRTVKEDGAPEKYDVEVDGSTLIESVKIPYIALTFEDVLYGQDNLFDIDFFDTNPDNTSSIWLKISDIVRSGFIISLYIALAVMLTLLIYMGTRIVGSTIFNREKDIDDDLEGHRRKHRFLRNPFRGLRDKKFVENWITSFICLSLLIFVINIIISFSDVLIDITNTYGGDDEKEAQTITVYVKGGVTSSSSSKSSSAPSSLMFIGDSRTVHISQIAGDSNNIFIAKSNEKYDYMVNTAFPEADTKIKSGMKVIIWMGVNEVDKVGMIDSYAEAINKKAEEWGKEGVKVAFATVGPCVQSYVSDNAAIDAFNKGVAEKLSNDVQVIDVFSYMKNNGYLTTSDGVHYTSETSKKIYDYMVDQAMNGTNSKISVIQDCYFDTNIEGLYGFQSQHDWEEYGVQNLVYEIGATAVAVTKGALYCVFVARMFLLAFIIILSPILILIDALKKINGNKGFLKKWVTVFIYLVLLRVAVNVLFYILTKTNIYTVAENPLYMAFIMVLILVFIAISLYKIIKYLIKKEVKKKK